MQNELITHLFYGELNPFESIDENRLKENTRAYRKFDKLYDEMEKTLSYELQLKLEDVRMAHDEMYNEIVLAAFTEGFKLGMGLMSEVIN